jgi:uncharacterized repeat protein (TIGR01451 family)
MNAQTRLRAEPVGFPWSTGILTLLIVAFTFLATPAALGQADSFALGTDLVDLSQVSGNETDPSVTINPLNPSNMVVVSAADGTVPGLFVWATTNLGSNWATQFIATNNDSQGLIAAYGYPSVAYDAFGNLFLAYLPATFEGVAVAVSTNAGRTFSLVTNLAPLDSTDQPRLTAPPMGTAAGSVWIVYKDYTTLTPFTPLQVQGLMSTGLGAIGAFGPEQFVPSSTSGGYADIAVGPQGQVMVAFQDNLQGLPDPAAYPTANIWVSVETNAVAGGNILTNANFRPAQIVASDAIGGITYLAAAPYGIGVNAAPGLAWDYDPYQPNYDKIYLVYTAVGPNGNAVISFMSSSDYGTSAGNLDTNWNGEIYVDDDALTGANDHFLPRVAVDPISDLIGCTWYDCRNDIGSGSMPVVNLYTNTFLFTNFSVTNVTFQSGPYVTIDAGTWSDASTNGSDIIINLTTEDMYGAAMTGTNGPPGATTMDIYIQSYLIAFPTSNNVVMGLEGKKTGNNVVVTVYLTDLFSRGYTTGTSGNQEAVRYASVSFNGGGSFLPNKQLPSATQRITAPAQGIASDDVEQTSFLIFGLEPLMSDSLTGWGHYAALACYGANFFAVWADNSDVTTNNPDGANGNFDLYTLVTGPGKPGIVVPTADLSIWVTNAPSPVISEGVIVYTLVVTNHGPVTASPVTVTDLLSPYVTLEAVIPALGGTYVVSQTTNGQQVVLTWPSLASNGVLTSTIRVTATTSSIDTNLATVSSPYVNLLPQSSTNVLVFVVDGQDLAMGMTTSETNVLIGDTVVTRVTVTNLGPSTNGPVFLTNVFSPNWTNVTVQAQGTNLVTNTPAGFIAIVNLGLLPTNKPVTAIFTAVATTAGTLGVDTYAYQTATVYSQDVDTNLADNSATITYFINGEDLVLGMTPSSPTVDQGEPITFALSVTNLGLSYSGLVTVTDTFSTNLTFLSATQSQGTNTRAGNQVVFSLGILDTGQVANLSVTALAPSGPPSTTRVSQAPSVTNFATVSSTDFSTNQVDTSAINIVPINGEELVLGMIPSSAAVDQGAPVTFALKVANLGLSYSGSVTVTDTFSTNLTFLSATQSQGTNTRAGNQVVFSLGLLDTGQVANLSITALAPSGPPSTTRVSPAPSVTNFATVSSTDFSTNPANVDAVNIVPINAEELVLGMTPSSPAVDQGAPITFALRVTNLGLSYSGLVTVTDTLSSNLTFLSATQSQGTNTVAGNQVVFSLGLLDTGQAANLSVTALAPTGPPATFQVSQAPCATNFATVSSTDFSTNLANAFATNIVPINGEDLAIALSASPASQQAGQPITFTEYVTNLGLSTNGVLWVTNTFSANLGSITVIQPATNYTSVNNMVVFDLGVLQVGQIVPITMTAVYPTNLLTGTNTATATDSATVDSQDFETEPVNNTAQASVTITAAQPVISNVVVTALAQSAFIAWDTEYPATVQVQYGTTTNYTNYSAVSATPKTNHVVLLTGLAGATNYDFEILAWVGSKLYTTNGSFTLTNTLILNTPEAYYSGVWTEGTAATGTYGAYYKYAGTVLYNPTSFASFDPFIPASALYAVSIWYPSNPAFTTNAQVYVTGPTNEFIVSVNETANGGAWQPLATNQYFAYGTNGSVILYNNTGETNKFLVANAMMWVYEPAQDYPTNGAVPAWWANYYFGANVNGYVNGTAKATNGYSIYANYVLGLDPTDAASTLSFAITRQPGNEVSITFSPSQGGRNYELQAAANLGHPVWTTLTNGFVLNTNGTGTFLVAQTNLPGAFYRLSAQIVP